MCMSRRTVGVRVATKERLKKMINDDDVRTMDDAVNKLLDNSEYVDIDHTRVNIHIQDDTLERLKRFKGHKSESNNDVLSRLLSDYK